MNDKLRRIWMEIVIT